MMNKTEVKIWNNEGHDSWELCERSGHISGLTSTQWWNSKVG
jgi:hypothetical protein